MVPPQYLTRHGCIIDNVNFEDHVLGSNHSYKVWEKIDVYFSLQTESHAQQLCCDTCYCTWFQNNWKLSS